MHSVKFLLLGLALLVSGIGASANAGRNEDGGGFWREDLCRGRYRGDLIINGVRTPIAIELRGRRAFVTLNGTTSQGTSNCDQYDRENADIDLSLPPFPVYSGAISIYNRTAELVVEGDGGKRVEAYRRL